MGYDPRLFIGEVDEELKCPICQLIVEKPVHGVNCNHIYCNSCIRSWLRQSLTCPLDRCPLTESQLRPGARIIMSILRNLEVRCSNSERGCCWTMKLCELEHHLTWCVFSSSSSSSSTSLTSVSSESSRDSKVLSSSMNEIRQLRSVCDKRSELRELRDLVEQLRYEMETMTASGEHMTRMVKTMNDNTDSVARYLQYAQSQMMRVFLSREEQDRVMSDLKRDNSLINVTVLNLSEFMTEEILMEYLRQNGMKPIKCVMGPYYFNRSRNFRVTVRLSDLDRLIDPNLWPIGAALTIGGERNKSAVIAGKRSRNMSTLCLESGMTE